MKKIFVGLLALFLISILGLPTQAQDRFDRHAVIPAQPDDIGGFGNIVAGVDFDNDGKLEIYAVNNDWHDVIGKDLTPRIYKYEQDENGKWQIVWWTELNLAFQNTWPAMQPADLDKDGKMEIVYGPVNNLGSGAQPNPERIVVFEAAGDGSDVMGVPDGNVAYRPNAQWTITDLDNQEIRPFRWFIYDIDQDGTDEIVAGLRRGPGAQIYSVDNIPDDGDSSEVWSLEFSGTTGTHYDCFILDSTFYLIQSGGDVTPVTWSAAGDSFRVGDTQKNVVPGGSWKSATVVDLDGDGTKEVLVTSWNSSHSEVFLLQRDADTLKTTSVMDVPDEAYRLYGGAAGDLDHDGLTDFVFGTRGSTPNGLIYRLEYQGGDITDPNNYHLSVLDFGISDKAIQYDVLYVANMDRDEDDEVLYTGTPRGKGADDPPQPIVILDRIPMNQPKILDVRDVPNDQGRRVHVVFRGAFDDMGGARFTAVLNGANFDPPNMTAAHGKATFTFLREQKALYYMLEVYNIDSLTMAHIHKGGPGENGPVGAFLFGPAEAGGPVNGVVAAGVIKAENLVGPYADNWEAFVNDFLAGNTYVNVHTATFPGGEIRGQILTDPVTGNLPKTSGFTITHYTIWRVDGDMHNRVPVQVGRVEAIQAATYAAVVPTLADSMPSVFFVTAHTPVTTVNWKSFPKAGFSVDNLAPMPPMNFTAQEIYVDEAKSAVKLSWDEALDPDFQYFELVRGTAPNFDPAQADLVVTTTATEYLDDKVDVGGEFYYKIRAVDFNGNKGKFSNEVSLTVTSVNDQAELPTEYALEQNYPNPFNPVTTIAFSLKEEGRVTLKVYSALGQEVATVVDRNYRAGKYQVQFDASNLSSGVYFYVLRVNGLTFKRKMSVLK